MEMKTCFKCKLNLPATTEYFQQRVNNKDGFDSHCKACRYEYMKKYKKENSNKRTDENCKCRVCGNIYPYTKEYFSANKLYKSGIDTRCRKCQNAYDRERYSIRRAKQEKIYKPSTEYQELIEERDKREEEIFNKIVNEKVVAGVYIKDVKLNVGQAYKVKRKSNEQKNKYVDHFKGIMVQDNKNNIVLKHKMGYCETFLKADLLIGEYKIKEVEI